MKPVPKYRTTLLSAIAVIVLMIALAAAWQLIVYARTAPNEKHLSVVVAALALFGTLWTGAIAFAGTMLKDSLDRRNALLAAEAEKRLRADTALKAVELMTKAETADATAKESREAAILVIASLDQPRLALTIGEQFWLTDKISTQTFVLIANGCLASSDANVKEDAALALRRNHKKLVIASDNLAFCDATVMAWNGTLPTNAKFELMNALIAATLSQTKDYWKDTIINWVIYALHKMFMNDDLRRFRCAAAMYARAFISRRGYGDGDGIMPPDQHLITFAELLRDAEAVIVSYGDPTRNISDEDRQLLVQIESWIEGKTVGPGTIERAEISGAQ